MIASSLAKGIPKDYGQAPGPPYLRGGKTCAAVLSKLFAHYHAQLVADAATVKVIALRLEGGDGFAILTFGGQLERDISVSHHHAVWAISTMLDNQLP